jgi:hypothetical protein
MAYGPLENVGSFLWSDKGSLLALVALVVAEQTPCEFVSLRVADRGKRNESHLGMIQRTLAPHWTEIPFHRLEASLNADHMSVSIAPSTVGCGPRFVHRVSPGESLPCYDQSRRAVST